MEETEKSYIAICNVWVCVAIQSESKCLGTRKSNEMKPQFGDKRRCNCCFLTFIQISQEAGKVAWYSHLFKNFPQFVVIHTVKGFNIVNEDEVDVFLEFSCFFNDSTDIGNLISCSAAFSKFSLNIWKFSVQVLLKPNLENFEHFFASMLMSPVVW